MAEAAIDVPGRIRDLRLELAGVVADLDEDDLDRASWCDGWRVRDVVGHLVHLAEATQRSMFGDIARNGMTPNRALARVGRSIGGRPPAELVERLRAAASGRFRVVGMPLSAALGEVVVHSNDALRPLDRSIGVGPADALAVIDFYRRFGRQAFGGGAPRGVQLVADDAAWTAGEGPEVRGRLVDLLLLLANRRQVAASLTGDGLDRL